VTATITDHALNIPFVVAFGWSPKLVFKQIVALQFAECLGTLAFAIAQYLGHRNLGVVVQDRLRYPTQKCKGSNMPIQKGFGIFSWIGFDKATIRMRHIKAEIMEANQFAANIAIGFTKVYLGMTR